MEEEKVSFSEMTEKAYKIETESAVNVPDGFKDSVMKRIKVEKMKRRKKAIIAVSSVAAALILVVGVVTLSMHSDILMRGENESYGDSDTSNNVDPIDNSLANVSDSIEKPDGNKQQHSDFFEDDNGYYDWSEFYEAVEEGKIDPSGEEAKKYVEDNRHYFEVSGMDEELEQSKDLINKVDPYEGFPGEEKQETDIDSMAEYSQMIKVFFALNFYEDAKTGESLNWFEFYNACLDADIDPRFGVAYDYLNLCHDFFVQRNNEQLIYQSELLLSAKGDLNQ